MFRDLKITNLIWIWCVSNVFCTCVTKCKLNDNSPVLYQYFIDIPIRFSMLKHSLLAHFGMLFKLHNVISGMNWQNHICVVLYKKMGIRNALIDSLIVCFINLVSLDKYSSSATRVILVIRSFTLRKKFRVNCNQVSKETSWYRLNFWLNW